MLLAAALVAVLAAGCDSASGDDRGRSGTAPASSAAPATTADPQGAARAAVVTAYRAWWADIIAANRNPDRAFSRLDDHMTGDALKTMKVFIVDRRNRGLVARGALKVGEPEVLSLSSTRATVRSCVDATRFVDYRAGKLLENSEGIVSTYRVGLTLARGWKVNSFSFKESACVA